MDNLFMNSQESNCKSCMITLSARIPDSPVNYTFVPSKTCYVCCLIRTFITRISNSLMNGKFVCLKGPLDDDLCWHNSQGYFTWSWTAFWWRVRLPFVVAWWVHRWQGCLIFSEILLPRVLGCLVDTFNMQLRHLPYSSCRHFWKLDMIPSSSNVSAIP